VKRINKYRDLNYLILRKSLLIPEPLVLLLITTLLILLGYIVIMFELTERARERSLKGLYINFLVNILLLLKILKYFYFSHHLSVS